MSSYFGSFQQVLELFGRAEISCIYFSFIFIFFSRLIFPSFRIRVVDQELKYGAKINVYRISFMSELQWILELFMESSLFIVVLISMTLFY